MISVLCKWEIYASKITKKELCSQFIWNGTLGTPLVIIIRWLHKIGFLLIKYHASIELYAVVLAVLNRLSVQHKVRETSNVGCTWSIWNEACGVKSLVSSCRIWPCTLQMLEGRYCQLIHVHHSFNSITAMSTTGERKARLDPVYSRCWKHATARWSLNIIYFIYHLWKLCHILVARVHTSWKKHWIVYGYWKLKYNMESHFCVRAMQRYTTICGEDIIIKKSQIKVFLRRIMTILGIFHGNFLQLWFETCHYLKWRLLRPFIIFQKQENIYLGDVLLFVFVTLVYPLFH